MIRTCTRKTVYAAAMLLLAALPGRLLSLNGVEGICSPFSSIVNAAEAAGDDTLKKWMELAPEDTNTLNVLLQLSQAMFRDRSPAEVEPYIDKVIHICNRMLPAARLPKEKYIIRKKLSRALIFKSMVYGYGYRDRKERERELLGEALKLLQEIDSPLGIANVYNNMAASYSAEEKFAEALSFHLKALRIREDKHDSAGLAQTYGGLSEIYFRTKKYSEALRYGNRALDIKRHQQDQLAVAERLSEIGAIYFETFEFEKATACWRRGLQLADSLGHVHLKANLLNNIGILHDALNAPDSAIRYHREAIALYTELSDGLNRASTVTNLGLALFTKGEYAKAKALLLPNVDSLKKYSQGELLEQLYATLVGCDSAMGDYRQALRHARLLHLATVKNIGNRDEEKMAELKMKYDSERMKEEHSRLQDEARIKTLEINRTRLMLLVLIVTLLFSASIFILLYFQHRHKAARKAIELEQRLLRTQMNPHFIFNALQAIQNYIMSHNQQESVRYLDAFASLAREVLDHSRVEVIPLSKEVEALKNYLELQKLRFMGRFEYEIQVSGKINPGAVCLPPMLSQPFIENAIEHGLSEVESGGRIKVSFDLVDGVLHMDITDNGSGMQAGDSRQKDHNSLAIGITKERIMLLNRKNRRQSSFTISDADPTAPDRKGVRVSFRIPLPLA